ncbi:MAG: cobyrinate a,c-diamide synthase [Gammaproteobacteria bacterium]
MLKPLLISSTKKSSGKTILSIGLSKIANDLKYNIQTFKKGPDFIDPSWLSYASSNPCYNLDFNTMSSSEIAKMYREKSKNSNLNIIEGTKGLYDGVSITGDDSNEQLALLLKAEILLIIDCEGMTRGIAPLLNGYKSFNRKLNINRVVLNNVSTARHETKLLSAIKEYTDFNVIGCIPKIKDFIVERHLGLIPTFQHNQKRKVLSSIATIIKRNINYKSLLPKMTKVKELRNVTSQRANKSSFTIGVAVDSAFGFYYPDDLEKIEKYGCKIKRVNLIKDKQITSLDALFIGGGFPETQARDLEKNKSMKKSIKDAIENGMPTYAECGGLMYLAKTIKFKNSKMKMCGVFDIDVEMHDKPIGRGYTKLITNNHPWGMSLEKINAHEFHYSSVRFNNKRYKYAYNIKRGYGINGKDDGLIYKNTIASFSHLRSTEQFDWVKNFTNFIKKING